MLKWLCLTFALTTASLVVGQYKFPIKENVEFAKTLKSKYKKQDVVCLNSTVKYSFDLKKNATTKLVEPICIVKTDEELISIKDNCSMVVSEFYDSFSKITYFNAYWNYNKSKTEMYSYAVDAAYESEGIFHGDMRYKALKVNFNALGDIASYAITKNYSDIRYVDLVTFMQPYPVEKKTIIIEIPSWLELDLKEVNFEGEKISKTVSEDPSSHIKTITYTVAEISANKKEANSCFQLLESPFILFHTKSFKQNNNLVPLFSSHQDLYKWLKELNDKVDNKPEKLKPLVAILTAGKTTDVEKIKSTYYWVQENIRYIAFEYGIAGFQSAPAYQVYENKYGDCKGMANLLVHLLRLQGYDAFITWVGTRGQRFLDYSTPSLHLDNHAICTVVLKDSIYYLDATESFISLGFNGYRLQGRPVLVSKPQSGEIMTVPEGSEQANLDYELQQLSISNTTMKGKVQRTLKNESKNALTRLLNAYGKSNQEELMRHFLHSDKSNEIISNVSLKNIEDRDKDTQIQFDYEIKNQITSIGGNELYIDFGRDKLFSNMAEKDRVSGIDLGRKYFIKHITEYTVPAGYAVKHIPQSVKESTDEFSLDLQFVEKGSTLVYEKNISFPTGMISKKKIQQWLIAQQKLKNFYEDQIIIYKK